MRVFPGMDTLLGEHADWLRGRRVGLVAHAASVDGGGRASVERLLALPDVRLAAVFGPEHGFLGTARAGEPVADACHGPGGIPVFSLYGATRRPTPEMLDRVDVVLFDLQDLGVRCYTYVATLRYVLEAAAACGKAVIVADRPVPLPRAVDGPARDQAVESFVAAVPAPLVYGMTPGETAGWLKDTLALDLDLRIAKMRGYIRRTHLWLTPTHWVPPSPGIRTPETACLYPATVQFEALPSVDYGRASDRVFRRFGAPWMNAPAVCEALAAAALPGVSFHPCAADAAAGAYQGKPISAVQVRLEDGERFQPARAAVSLAWALQQVHGIESLWGAPGTRTDHFDRLMGTARVREALRQGAAPPAIFAGWESGLSAFRSIRARYLLYEE